MITIILKVIFFIIAVSLSACTSIKVVEVAQKIEMPKFEYECNELELLQGASLLDALNTIKNNEVIHQQCINLAEQQNKFIQKLAK